MCCSGLNGSYPPPQLTQPETAVCRSFSSKQATVADLSASARCDAYPEPSGLTSMLHRLLAFHRPQEKRFDAQLLGGDALRRADCGDHRKITENLAILLESDGNHRQVRRGLSRSLQSPRRDDAGIGKQCFSSATVDSSSKRPTV